MSLIYWIKNTKTDVELVLLKYSILFHWEEPKTDFNEVATYASGTSAQKTTNMTLSFQKGYLNKQL